MPLQRESPGLETDGPKSAGFLCEPLKCELLPLPLPLPAFSYEGTGQKPVHNAGAAPRMAQSPPPNQHGRIHCICIYIYIYIM